MPKKNVRKPYIENGYYHIYNRGVDKKDIYKQPKDYEMFLGLLKEYLSPPPSILATRIITLNQRPVEVPVIPRQNYYQQIVLMTYCLMPNHYHLLIRQTKNNSLGPFMKSLGVRYTMYFNKRYQRQGPLFESTYRAVLVETDEQLLHLSRYIHLNPLHVRVRPLRKGLTLLTRSQDPLFSQPSSYPEYLGKRQTPWVNTDNILEYFRSRHQTTHRNYQEFITAQIPSASQSSIDRLTLD